MLKQLEARGASVTDREAVISSLGQAWRNLPYFVGAYGVAFVPDLLGYIGTGIAAAPTLKFPNRYAYELSPLQQKPYFQCDYTGRLTYR